MIHRFMVSPRVWNLVTFDTITADYRVRVGAKGCRTVSYTIYVAPT